MLDPQVSPEEIMIILPRKCADCVSVSQQPENVQIVCLCHNNPKMCRLCVCVITKGTTPKMCKLCVCVITTRKCADCVSVSQLDK